MDNRESPHFSSDSAFEELENIDIFGTDSDDAQFYYSDSEPETLSSTTFPVQYMLPRRNHSMVHSPNRTLMGRMANFNKSVRMKHGTTALDIIVPLNRDTTTPLNSGTPRRNLTMPLNSGTVPHDTTMQFRTSAQNLLPASSSHVPGQWMSPSPSSSSSLNMTASYRPQVSALPLSLRSSGPPYRSPPTYKTTSHTSQTSTLAKSSQSSAAYYSTVPNRTPPFMPIYTPQTTSLSYDSRSSSMSYTTQSSTMPNISQTPKYYIRNQYRIPPYTSPHSCPPYSTQSSMPINTSPSFVTSDTSKTSTYYIRNQYRIPPYTSPHSCPPYPTQSSMPIYTSLSSVTSNTSQTSTCYTRSHSSMPSCGIPFSTPPFSSEPSVPICTPRSSTSIYNLTPSSHRINPRSAHYSASPTYSHYTFPRSAHYTMPVLQTYCTEMPQSSTQNSHPSGNVWPTQIGSVMQASMQNIRSVLSDQSRPSTTTRTDENASRPSTEPPSTEPPSTRANNKPQKFIDPKAIIYTLLAYSSSARELFEEKMMKLYNDDVEKQHKNFIIKEDELKKAWEYFSKMEVVDIKPNGEIKCICPTMKYEDLLRSSINDKFMLVNLYHLYKDNNLLFETKYDYNSSPQTTIVTENIGNDVLQWLKSNKMENYIWFFNSLNLFEIENINPTNIQKFIMRSKSTKVISLEDQLKICCMVKKIKERPVSLLAILMNLREDRIDKEPFQSTVFPYIFDILQFPISVKNFVVEDVSMRESVTSILRILIVDIMKFLNEDLVPDINNVMGYLPDIGMVNFKVICMNQIVMKLFDTEGNIGT
ncbi:uncharacterized protein LOC111042729 [Myzus persicae]|uniref:uncharacterized protein LOC111042729 n=1 Tax=Myzus persicae TaxID=13164 RepID=UPI000B93626C|nr:uncharacterized protein LOC111042729 [Myzus persicae]